MPGSANDRVDTRRLGCLKEDGMPAGGGPVEEDAWPAWPAAFGAVVCTFGMLVF